jgi:hypothetical protein
LTNPSSSSQLNLTKPHPPTPEIYGLLHLLTASASSDTDKLLLQHAEAGTIDVYAPIPFEIYANGKTLKEVDWRTERKRIDAVHPIVVFSKVRLLTISPVDQSSDRFIIDVLPVSRCALSA